MTSVHHISDELLAAYAGGQLPEPLALLVATHLTLCPEARRRCRAFEAIAGVMLDAIEPEPVAADLRSRLLARLDALPEPSGGHAAPPIERPRGRVPAPLAAYIGDCYEQLPWRSFGAVSEVRLMPNAPGFVTRLLRIRPGVSIPDHTHEGLEATLVLQGSFSDQTGTYGVGDVALHEGDVDHAPVAGPGEVCICLAVTDAPLRLTGSFGRLLNPFVRI